MDKIFRCMNDKCPNDIGNPHKCSGFDTFSLSQLQERLNIPTHPIQLLRQLQSNKDLLFEAIQSTIDELQSVFKQWIHNLDRYFKRYAIDLYKQIDISLALTSAIVCADLERVKVLENQISLKDVYIGSIFTDFLGDFEFGKASLQSEIKEAGQSIKKLLAEKQSKIYSPICPNDCKFRWSDLLKTNNVGIEIDENIVISSKVNATGGCILLEDSFNSFDVKKIKLSFKECSSHWEASVFLCDWNVRKLQDAYLKSKSKYNPGTYEMDNFGKIYQNGHDDSMTGFPIKIDDTIKLTWDGPSSRFIISNTKHKIIQCCNLNNLVGESLATFWSENLEYIGRNPT